MSNAGRPKLAKEIKEARGTLEKSRELKNPMQPEKVKKEEMKVPAFLNQYGKVFYRFYFNKLTELGVLTVTDLDTLGLMSAEYGRYLECQYHIQKNGMVITGTNKNGSTYEMVSPYISIANNCYKNYYNMMSRFGVSPSDRQKLSTFTPTEEDNEVSLDAFLNNN
ncbi:phage terminase small subunit P27 family [Litoribacter ruber]|uniref:phage terminase small subunit P27 family n=1 Tax=Litoribacter ruber TaxID=702568 RepID=UPI001BDAC326|nr:phage terminase small subunit P27 family [Litoribacter ruber]MBT0810489.1 phage terminase small subunit P27 family [Litoribacter ruber]